MERFDLMFQSAGLDCSASLYMPSGESKPGVVVMAHGFAAEQVFRLPAFAQRFVEKGLAVFTFDYRGFGMSQGQPRNLVDPRRHLEDWRSAIAFVRGLELLDGERLGLWGSSFSGGHVLVTAARDSGVKAVVAQVPFVDGLATIMSFSLKYNLTGLFHGILDMTASLFGKVHYVPVVSDPDRFGLMNTQECMSGYLSLVPEGTNWKNQAPARIALTLPLYRPIACAERISCPVLMICAEKDSLIPAVAVIKCAGRIKSCRLEILPAGHFEVYSGEYFEKAVKAEAEFLAANLL